VKAINTQTGKVLATNVKVADTIFTRMKGLLGIKNFHHGDALWIKPCFSVHTFFMQFPIDVLFLNRHNQVIEAIVHLTPNRLSRLYPKAFSVLELPIGTIDASQTAIGHEIKIEE
jgi:hypothetical protein